MRKRNPFLWLFAIGMFLGIVFLNFEKGVLLQSTGIWDADMIARMASLSLGGSALFVSILSKRGIRFLGVTILSTTYLGTAVCVLGAFGYGFMFGGYVAGAVLRHGIKGILLACLGIMPQYLFYGPMIYGLFVWCSQTCGWIYGKRGRMRPDNVGLSHAGLGYMKSGVLVLGRLGLNGNAKAPVLAERVLSWLFLLALLLVGCVLESYLGPKLLAVAAKLV